MLVSMPLTPRVGRFPIQICQVNKNYLLFFQYSPFMITQMLLKNVFILQPVIEWSMLFVERVLAVFYKQSVGCSEA
jgi:hypothetical protein